MVIGKILKSEGFNLRERLNMYAGAALGALIPIIAMKYAPAIIDPSRERTWINAIMSSLPFTVYPLSTILGGFAAGYYDARRLKDKRCEKERKKSLENEI